MRAGPVDDLSALVSFILWGIPHYYRPVIHTRAFVGFLLVLIP